MQIMGLVHKLNTIEFSFLYKLPPVTITKFCCVIYCPINNCDKRYYCHFKTILCHSMYNHNIAA